MKSFVVVFAICIVGALAGLTEEQKAKVQEYRTACITETGADNDKIQKLIKGEAVELDDKLNCYGACMLKKVGIMKADGTIDEEVARAKIPKDVPHDKIEQIINTCKVLVGKDTCETGGKIISCMSKNKAAILLQ